LKHQAKALLDWQRLVHPLCKTGNLPTSIGFSRYALEKTVLFQSGQVISHITIRHAPLSIYCGLQYGIPSMLPCWIVVEIESLKEQEFGSLRWQLADELTQALRQSPLQIGLDVWMLIQKRMMRCPTSLSEKGSCDAKPLHQCHLDFFNRSGP
jgi:hypothetical protein